MQGPTVFAAATQKEGGRVGGWEEEGERGRRGRKNDVMYTVLLQDVNC